ncbi:putative UPF0481 protein At3g02645 [Bidens hawaiensis]|uniref:putative UPF0481 protein At3g02645 n=1 Tax=Bidens hawaiensis TaxID=980011 RepID=UPI00404B2D79
MVQGSDVQRLLYHVKNKESHINRLPPTIYMAPRTVRDKSPGSFNPRVVSIGPLHREDENVQAFEGKKAGYLINLMRRAHYPLEVMLNLCVQKVYTSMEKIKACYDWPKIYDDAEIVDMMIIDACFITEFLCMEWGSNVEGELFVQNVLSDLVLLENQIPFFFLDEIFQCTILQFYPNASLLKLIYPVLCVSNVFETRLEFNNISFNNTQHILSLLHQCYKPPDNVTKGNFPLRIPSVSDLDRAGVNFKPYKNPTWLMGLEVKLYRLPCFFGCWSKPTLRIPVLKVDDSTEFVLRNLIAYEQSRQNDTYVTSYAFAMDTLVDTPEDVFKLVESRVIVNHLGSNEEAAKRINNICKGTLLKDCFYHEEWEKLSKYYDSYWPKNIAKMKRIYFSSPWSMITLLAGIILFVLTVIQTIFTIKSA